MSNSFNKIAKNTVVFLASTILFASTMQTQANDTRLPDLGAPDLSLYDPQTEQKLGEAFIKSLHTDFTLSDDSEIADYIQQVGRIIAAHSGQNRPFRFYVIDNPTINAFAGPDGVIGIHTGLIEAVRSEAELASVIAHEIAHITQQHLSRRYLYNTTQGTTTSVATLLAAILIGMIDPNAGMATLLSGQSLSIQNQLKNSRQHENEADFVGIKILYDSGYDAHAMADFFGRLAEESRNDTFKVPEILRTHPVSENRLVQADNRANSLTPINPDKYSEPLTLIKLRLSTQNTTQQLSLNGVEKNLTQAESCYLLNLIELKKTTPTDKHLECLGSNAQTQFNHSLYNNLLLARLTGLKQLNTTTLQKYKSQALAMAKFHRDLQPNQQTNILNTALFLRGQSELQAAIDWLESSNQNLTYSFRRHNLLAILYDQTNQPALAYLHQAYAQMAIFNTERAKHFIDQAKQLDADNNGQNQGKIKKFLTEYGVIFEENNEKSK